MHRNRPSPVGVSWLVVALAGASSCMLLPPGTPVDFCIEQARVFCDLQYRCCTAAERSADPLGVFRGAATQRHAPSSAGECADVLAEVCRAGAEQLNESLVAERIEYDAEEAAECLSDLRQAVDECDATEFFEAGGSWLAQLIDNGQPGVLGDSCDNAIEPKVDTGDDCFASWECERGACVVQNSGNDVSAEGECTGEGTPQNPFDGTVELEICDGLEDNQP